MPALELIPLPDEHNPIGSNFRPMQTQAIYGYTPRLVNAAEVLAQRPLHHAPQRLETPVLRLVPREVKSSSTFDLSDLEAMPLSSRRLALICATRIIERAQRIEDDGATRDNLAFYVAELRGATKAFENSMKPKTGLRSLFERLFEDKGDSS